MRSCDHAAIDICSHIHIIYSLLTLLAKATFDGDHVHNFDCDVNKQQRHEYIN